MSARTLSVPSTRFTRSGLAVATALGTVFAVSLLASAADAEPAATETPTGGPPAGQESEATTPLDAAEHDAKRHFENGIKLYRDGNHAGALAEFEASYELKPSPSSLQNIALSLKGLFRYAQAADALSRLLERHGSELSTESRDSIGRAMQELESLVGTLIVETQPPDAIVTIDGHRIPAAQLASGVRLNVGEHPLTVEGAGYAGQTTTARIAGRSQHKLSLKLEPTHGFISIEAVDPKAAIAVDGEGRAFHRWKGPLLPGRHKVQVYRDGFEQFEQDVFVELGQTLTLTAELGPPIPEEELEPSGKGLVKKKPPDRGYYGLLALSFVSLDDAPQDLDIDGVRSKVGGSFGARAGYRIFSPVGLELLLEGGRHDFKDACDVNLTPGGGAGCDGSDAVTRDYALESFRIGGNVRVFSSGSKLRFTSTVGFGMVRHKLTIGGVDALALPERKASGVDPYFLAEVGAQYSWGHLLLELDVLAFVNGAGGIEESVPSDDARPIFGNSTSVLPMIGLGLRAGWGEWSP